MSATKVCPNCWQWNAGDRCRRCGGALLSSTGPAMTDAQILEATGMAPAPGSAPFVHSPVQAFSETPAWTDSGGPPAMPPGYPTPGGPPPGLSQRHPEAPVGMYPGGGGMPVAVPQVAARADVIDVISSILAGLVAAMVCAAVWALLVTTTHYTLSLVGIGVGIAVGSAMCAVSPARGPLIAVIAALLAVAGCALGDFFGRVGILSQGGTFLGTLGNVTAADVPRFITPTGIEALFWALAAFYAFRVTLRPGASFRR